MQRRVLYHALMALSLATAACAASAQAAAKYPSRPIKIVVPFAPGGTTDALARLVGQHMTQDWGQAVVIENKPGAGATLGADAVAKAPGDGYTLLMGAAHHTIAQNVYAKVPYHFGRDFAPVTVVAMVPNMVVVNANVPARTIQEFIALAKSQPGKLNYGSAGAGTAHHLIGEMFKLRAGVDLVHVPYKGSSPAVADLLSGQVQLMFDTVTSGLPQVKAGKTRALAVTTAKRSSALPDVPSLSETVLPGFDVGTWFGILAPAATPPDIVNKLNAEIVKIINTPEVRKQMLEMGSEPVGNTPAQMAAQIKTELDAFGAVVKQIKLTVE
ncbi:tripartite tricarboxylate transporter substrate binding protein [Ramlibacter sp.]|uniref:tripartite tricarboxylate transporter substrate binding protein n=1 Tax=Ramlibacter sp. TaxID=1917967 RepID=UPI002BD6B346|nr:tripartite tricarboxylate transporter substrate binding protein [Ramlibacter sp.]HWI80746.1 tripartite tricarboxylate transporter substrate binding protein [Ramlibacter sp.]